jgi:hypothetical protein
MLDVQTMGNDSERFLTAIIEREDELYVALCPEFDIASQGGSGASTADLGLAAFVHVSNSRHWLDAARMLQEGVSGKADREATRGLAATPFLTRNAGLLDSLRTSSPLDTPKGLGRGYFF